MYNACNTLIVDGFYDPTSYQDLQEFKINEYIPY